MNIIIYCANNIGTISIVILILICGIIYFAKRGQPVAIKCDPKLPSTTIRILLVLPIAIPWLYSDYALPMLGMFFDYKVENFIWILQVVALTLAILTMFIKSRNQFWTFYGLLAVLTGLSLFGWMKFMVGMSSLH